MPETFGAAQHAEGSSGSLGISLERAGDGCEQQMGDARTAAYNRNMAKCGGHNDSECWE